MPPRLCASPGRRPAPLERGDVGFVRENDVDLVHAFEQTPAGGGVDGEGSFKPEAIADLALLEIHLDTRSRLRARRGRGSRSTAASGSATGSMPLPMALLRKMSANDGAITTRKPASWQRPRRVLA